MKQHSSITKERLVNLEEGLIPEAGIFTRVRSAASNNPCKQIAQCVKIILYLLFVGLAGYAMWQTFSINSMEFKVINSIRESDGFFAQRSTIDKKSVRNAAGQFHQSNVATSTTKNIVASDLDSKVDENDDESLNATDTDVYTAFPDDALPVATESYETDSERVVKATASTDQADEITFTRQTTITTTTTTTTTTDESPPPIEDADSNSSVAIYEKYDEYLATSDEMKLERDQEEIFDALLSLIIRNAVRNSQIIDSSIYYDNRLNDYYVVSATLDAQNSNDVEEENSNQDGTQETQETLKLFVNDDDYEEGNSENSDYQTEETVTESPAKDYYGQFYRQYHGPWRIYI